MRRALVSLLMLAIVLPGCMESRAALCDVEVHSTHPSETRRVHPAPLPWSDWEADAPEWLVRAMSDPTDPEQVHAVVPFLEWADMQLAYEEAWHAFYGEADASLVRASIRDDRMYFGTRGETVQIEAEWPHGDCPDVIVD